MRLSHDFSSQELGPVDLVLSSIMGKNSWVVIFLFAMSVIFGTVAFVTYSFAHKLEETGVTAHGTVVRLDYSPGSGSHSSGVYYPVVKFQTADGTVVEERSHIGSSPPDHKEGDAVEILYEKTNPKSWCVNSFWEMYLFPVIFGFFSVALLIATVITFFVMAKGAAARNSFTLNRM